MSVRQIGSPLIQYWHEEDPPDYIGDLLEGFRDRNPDLEHRIFDRASAGAFIAERFGTREFDAFQLCAMPAMQADYLRYCAVFALGGIYCDADLRCIAPLRPLLPPPGCGRLFRGSAGNVINGLFAFGSSQHPFLRLALEVATANIELRRFESVYHTTGPPILMTLRRLAAYGSVSRLMEAAQGTPFAAFVEPYCETIRKYGELDGVFDGVEVSEVAAQDDYVRVPQVSLPYKLTSNHWVDFRGSIFT